MLKKLVLVLALGTTTALAQQNTDITGADFLSGAADSTLGALGREAAASGKRLVIVAPADWHARIAARVRAGGDPAVVLRDGFYENILVRVEDESRPAAAAAATDPVAASRAEAERMRAEAERARSDAERARAEAERARAEAEASRAEAERAQAELTATREAQRQAEAAAAAAAAAEAAADAAETEQQVTAANAEEAARERLAAALIGGRAAAGSLSPDQLRGGDVIYVDEPVLGVIRREGLKATLWWLQGDLDLRRSELKPLADNRYEVISILRGDGQLRAEFRDLPALEFSVPSDAGVRAAMASLVSGGRPFDEVIAPADLRRGDVVYVTSDGGGAAVVRRDATGALRFWLEGRLDVNQPGVRADGPGRYRILGDRLR